MINYALPQNLFLFWFLCVRVCICVYMCACVHVSVCSCMCEGGPPQVVLCTCVRVSVCSYTCVCGGVHLRWYSSGAVHLVTWDRVSHWDLELDHLARLASQGAIGSLPFQPHSTRLWLFFMWVQRTKLRPLCLWTSALSMGCLCSGLPHRLTSTLADWQEDETKNTPKKGFLLKIQHLYQKGKDLGYISFSEIPWIQEQPQAMGHCGRDTAPPLHAPVSRKAIAQFPCGAPASTYG